MLNPIHLRTLQSVLRFGSFSHAALALGYTASAVSQQMRSLERATGLVLFEREAHGIRATVAAKMLGEESRSFLRELEDLQEAVREMTDGRRGRLRLGSFPTASVHLLPIALANFLARRPKDEISFVEGEPDELIPFLLAGDLDVVLVYEYSLVPTHWPSEIQITMLFEEELVLQLPVDNSVARASGIKLAHLRKEQWISTLAGTAGSTALDRLCATAGFSPHIVFRSNDYDVIRALVRAGLGVALVPQLGHSPDPQIQASSLRAPTATRRVLAVNRANSTNVVLHDALAALAHASDQLRDHLRLE